MGEPAVSVQGLRVVRGGREVLKSVNLSLPAGRISGLLGPSGCGKTTLMRAIVGVQIISGGTVSVLGEPAGHASLRRRIGYVTQAPSIYDDLSVEANVRYFRRIYGVPEAAARDAIALVGLDDHAHKLVRNLSGGQRTRASLATALLAKPEILILDEPTVGLDPVLREELWNTFSALTAAGTTLLISSHVMDEAERCDDLILMRDGEILIQCTPAELLESSGAPNVEQAFLAIVRKQGAPA